MAKGTLEVGLKDQEDVFHRQEMKVQLGRGGQRVVSGTGTGMGKATRQQENPAHLKSCMREGRMGQQPRDAILER